MDETSPVVVANLSMVVLATPDVEALAGFYRSLGWPEQPGGSPELRRFDLGAVVLALYASEEAAVRPAPGDPVRPSTTLVIKVASADAVDAAHGAVLGAGGQPVTDPTDQPWGGRAAVVADPEGNRWELLWVPPAAG